MTGASPTTAKSRPPSFRQAAKASGRSGVEPVSTIRSKGAAVSGALALSPQGA